MGNMLHIALMLDDRRKAKLNNYVLLENPGKFEYLCTIFNTTSLNEFNIPTNLNENLNLKTSILLKLTRYSLIFISRNTGKVLLTFMYKNILSWGKTNLVFKFTFWNCNKEECCIIVKTKYGHIIDKKLIQYINELIVEMDNPT